jgi:glutamate synthase domain-containing protein 2
MKPHARYHIDTQAAPTPFAYPARFLLTEGETYVKYGHPVFEGTTQRGDAYWTAEIITQTWYMAETGRIPISGAGYGGKFGGDGFEGIWLDMSEIVRPTRDGIHGRETISTQVDIGGGLPALTFDAQGRLASPSLPTLSLPMPVLFNLLPIPLPGRGAIRALALAAARLGLLSIIDPSDLSDELMPHLDALAPRISTHNFEAMPSEWSPRYVEVEEEREMARVLVISRCRERWPDAVIAARLPFSLDVPTQVESLVRDGVSVIHLFGDDMGVDLSGRHLVDAIRAVHSHLVSQSLRDRVTLIVSGGVAAADHVAKSIACGADALAIDFALQIAWGCALWADKGMCTVETKEIDAEWGARRIVNLMNAWRDQLLEALGAMGLRELRRLRGEVGRTIWHRGEEGYFKSLLGGSLPEKQYTRWPEPEGGEGDFRWTQALILSSHQQARTGQPPAGEYEYRVGRSDGGFDRLAFKFEVHTAEAQSTQSASEDSPRPQRLGGEIPSADPAQFDLSLPLNRRGDGRLEISIPLPWYGAGMSYGSVGLPVMLSRAKAAAHLGTFSSTGEGGYPEELEAYADHIITQVATGLFGVREDTLQRARIIEIKYAQGAKPGLGGHLLGNKNTESVARIREAVQGTSLFSPFPFHSVYSVEDHKKHVDWLKQVNPRALISVKVSTPTDVDMVAVGSYYAGAHVVQLDGAYGGTGAAPEIAKKNIAMPLEYAIPKVHRFLEQEGVRDEVTLMASGGIRTAYDVAKAIALGADGCIIGTAELVAIGCIRIAQCEKGLGCPFGITTTDPEHAKKIDAMIGWQKIVNLYTSWLWQLAGILDRLGMRSVAELRGRSDVLIYLD